MRHFSKIGMSAATLALAASGIAAVFAVPATAASSKPHGKITCTQINGSVSSGFVTISGCSGSAVPGTGGSSQPLPFASLVSGGTIDWVNGQTTTISQPTLVANSKPQQAKKCPGYIKPTKTNPNPSGEPTLEKFTAAVTADSTGLKVPGKAKGEACIDSAGNITAPKPTKFS